MKTKKINKINMFNSLTKVMDGNNNIWSGVKEIEKAYKTFLDETKKINSLSDEYNKDLQKLIDRKSEARKNILTQIFPISNIILAFAIENKHKKLVEYSKTIWKEAKKLYNNVDTISEDGKKNQNTTINIQNYGLTGQMIDKLEFANVTLVDARLKLKEALDNKKDCSKKITAGISKNIRILKNKLDLLITIFEASNPRFYSDFVAARSISTINDNIKKKDKSPRNI